MGFILNIIIFLASALVIGFGSAFYMVDTGSTLTTKKIGPWSIWTQAARDDADPYTRAHFARTGALPLSTRVARTYRAHADSSGRKLQSNCDYAVDGRGPNAVWWSLSVYNIDGSLIANPANRHTFTSRSIMRRPSGEYTVTLARAARSGNWLPTVRAKDLVLVLSVQQPNYINQFGQDVDEASELPSIKRTSCR